MTELRIARVVALAAASGLWLASCGGSDAPAPPAPPVTPIAPQDDGRILAGSDDIVAADFVGRTFPLVYELAENVPARSERGIGSVTVLDNDTLLVTIPERDVRRFVRDVDNTFVDGSGVTAEFTDYGPARYLSVETPFGLSSAFGFETPVSGRPASATFNGLSASVVILTIPGRDAAIGVGGEGSVSLMATFTGSGGRITGTLFDNFALPAALARVELDAGAVADELYLRTELDGTITEGGFTGSVALGSARVRMNGGPEEDFGLVLGANSATGKFFGPAAQAVAGTYSADANFTIPGQIPQSGQLTGFFVSN